ncbi:MAG: ATP-binding protein [Firmicutes bacterium]|jgi:predicted transcriptional regulator|nr:ATP-binding protein [Bacillota bacterium]
MISLFSRLFRKRTEIHNKTRISYSDNQYLNLPELGCTVRIAVYDSLNTIPRIVDIQSDDYNELLNKASSKTYALSQDKGGIVPYIAIKEIVENLLHACIQEAVITILPDGNTIRVSDQGSGIPDKERAFLPGFTTASSKMKETVRGVGSGLPIVRDTMHSIGGFIHIEDNLNGGCVITLSCSKEYTKQKKTLKGSGIPADVTPPQYSTADASPKSVDMSQDYEKLKNIISPRRQRVFMILAGKGEGGPSLIAKELKISLSTAYRDLVALEEYGLIQTADNTGKRELTSKGIEFLPYITG